MRCLSRNKQTVYYALYSGKVAIEDENGNETGEYAIAYDGPVKLLANVSAARGTAEQEMFGIGVNYTKTIIVDDVNCPIDEHSVLWIDKATSEPHNYVVERVARSLNSVVYAVRKVDVS